MNAKLGISFTVYLDRKRLSNCLRDLCLAISIISSFFFYIKLRSSFPMFLARKLSSCPAQQSEQLNILVVLVCLWQSNAQSWPNLPTKEIIWTKEGNSKRDLKEILYSFAP